MAESIAISTSGPVRGSVRPPGSKSLTNRALLCAALASGRSRLAGILDSDDTRIMVAALRQVGVEVAVDWAAGTADLVGTDGRLAATDQPIFVGNSGTTARFLLPVLAVCGEGTYRMDGTPRMRERPMAGLVHGLQAWGIEVQASPGKTLPLVCVARRPLGGEITIASGQSSQFLSGMLIASPYCAGPCELAPQGDLVSAPFVEMTRTVMAHFGVASGRNEQAIRVEPGNYRGADFSIEPDATAASYFFAAAAITRGEVVVEGLAESSCQGDLRFVELLRQMGCDVTYDGAQTSVRGNTLRGIDCEMGEISDTVPTLAVVALFAQGETRIRGVAHNRFKESNRIEDLAMELRRVGGDVEETEDGLIVRPCPLHGAELETHDDHRLAMSLALIGLNVPGTSIANPECVGKTYPGYFDDLRRVIGSAGA